MHGLSQASASHRGVEPLKLFGGESVWEWGLGFEGYIPAFFDSMWALYTG